MLQDVVSHAISIYKNYSLATYRLIQRWYFDRWVVERGGRIVVSIITGRAHTHTYTYTHPTKHMTLRYQPIALSFDELGLAVQFNFRYVGSRFPKC